MILQATDFIDKPYGIPNQEEFREFVAFIYIWEEKLLKYILGYDLYTELIASLNESNPDQKWVDLKDGSTYIYSSFTNEWVGIVMMIKPAIYSEWIKVVTRRFTTSGMVSFTAQQNTVAADPMYEIVNNWNEYAKSAGARYDQCNSLYGFLKANEDDYKNENGDLIFTPPQIKNQFDL